jgi:hypothetical protein
MQGIAGGPAQFCTDILQGIGTNGSVLPIQGYIE